MNSTGDRLTIRPTIANLSRTEIVTWAAIVVVLAAILKLHLLSALLAGMVVYELVQSLARVLRFSNLRRQRAKFIAVGLVAAAVVAVLAFAGLGLIATLRHGTYSVPTLMQRLADIIERSRDSLPGWSLNYLPEDPERLRLALVDWLRTHTGLLTVAGQSLGRNIAHILIGMVIGALLSLHDPDNARGGPLKMALVHHAVSLSNAFRRIVFAQFWISFFNTSLTAIYLLAILPLFIGAPLPLTKTLLLLTFVVGLLPILGNLISNTAIVLVSMSHSLGVAGISLVYLIAIHKLEYFLNARIIGGHILARAWELLIAMVAMEAIFGLAGLIAAPVFYSYAKDQALERGWI